MFHPKKKDMVFYMRKNYKLKKSTCNVLQFFLTKITFKLEILIKNKQVLNASSFSKHIVLNINY